MQPAHAAPAEPPAHADLRRRPRADAVRRLLARAPLLESRDRALLEAAFRDGKHASELALLRGEPPDHVRRVLRRLVHRINSPIFEYTLREFDQWPTTRRRVALRCIIRGQAQRDAADEMRVSIHVVRAHLAWIGMRVEALDPTTRTTHLPATRPFSLLDREALE